MAEGSPSKDSLLTGANADKDGVKTASSTVAKIMDGMINTRDMQEIIESQSHILSQYERTNEMLNAANAFASVRYETISKDFKKNAACLMDMKRNLDTIFKRVRSIKQTLRTNHPEAYEACKTDYAPPDFDDNPETSKCEGPRDSEGNREPKATDNTTNCNEQS